MPSCFGSQEFRHIGVGAALLAGVEQCCGAAADHVGRFELGIGACQRELHPLVLADRAVEDDPLLGVFDALVEQPAAVADAFLGDQDALGVRPVEDAAPGPSAVP